MSQCLAWGINMYQRKTRFLNSILFRMSLWVLFLGACGIFLITCFVKMQMRYNIEKQITDDMQQIRDNSLLYVHQILLLNDAVVDEDGFEQCIQAVDGQLKSIGYRETAYYDLDRKILILNGSKLDNGIIREDFKRAVEHDSTFTLNYGAHNQCDVYFTMPVEITGKRIGFISYYFDYQALYQREWNTFGRTIWIIVLVFMLICLVIWAMLYRVISSMRSLSQATSEISGQISDEQFDSNAIRKLLLHDRKDELGELAGNFLGLLRVAEDQFQKIQQDKEQILRLLNSRQNFYNNVTHELKTPLTTISGYAQLMKKNGLGDTELFYKGTDHILRESTRLHRMVVQLLEMQDEEHYQEQEYVNLSDILKNVADDMQIKARRQECRLLLEGTEKSYLVYGREDKIRQVLINLIDNAIKYGEPKETVSLKIASEKDYVKISVSNKGCGIKKEDLENIFEPFYRADKELSRELGSTGLGLAISKKIMKEHGGRIEVMSILGEDTVFTVTFPAEKREEKLWSR